MCKIETFIAVDPFTGDEETVTIPEDCTCFEPLDEGFIEAHWDFIFATD